MRNPDDDAKKSAPTHRPQDPLEATRSGTNSEVAASNALLQSIFDELPMRIFWKDRSLRYLGCNAAFARDAGWASAAEVVGKDDSQFARNNQAEEYRREDQCVIDNNTAMLGRETMANTADGSTVWRRVSKLPLHDAHGVVIGLLGLYDDVTELVQSRALIHLRTKLLEIIVQSRRSLNELLEEMIRAAEATIPEVLGSVLLMDTEGRHLRHAAAPSLPPAFTNAINGIEIGPQIGSCGTAAYFAKEVIVSDIASDPRWRDYQAAAHASGLAACYSEPILDESGKVQGTFAMYWPRPKAPTASDLDAIRMMAKVAAIAIERQRTDQSLRESEARYQDLYDNAPDMFLSVDGDTGCLLNCNQTLLTTLGYTKEELIGQPVFVLYHPESIAAAHEAFAHFVRHGEVRNADLQARHKNGTPIAISLSTTAVRDVQGKVLYSRGIWRNLTERVRLDETLHRTQLLLQSLLDNSPAIIYIKDPQGKYLLVNHLYETLMNTTQALVIGKTDHDIFPQSVADTFRSNDLQALASSAPIQNEVTAPTTIGPRTYIAVKFAIKNAAGGVVGIGGISTDITDAKRAAAQAQATKQLLNEAFERVTDAFVSLDDQWRFTFVNARAGELLGRKPEDLIGQNMWTAFPEGDDQPFHRAYEQAFAEQKKVQFEQYYPPLDSWFLLIVYPSKQGLSLYFHDVTERKKAQLALQAQQAQLEQTVKDRTAELTERVEQLRRFALLTADRELRIQELRRENEKLRLQLGNAAPSLGYPQ